jgi:hypothetical protein
MKNLQFIATIALLITSHFSFVRGHDFHQETNNKWTSARPDGHAPIGVMGDHAHKSMEWMIGYRYSFSHFKDLQEGTKSINVNELFVNNSFAMAPQKMDMHMHMLEIMFAPTEWVTLMLMPQYMRMDMEMVSSPNMTMSSHSAHSSMTGKHSHTTEGIGDTSASAILSLWNDSRQAILLGIGVSIPTGSVSQRSNDRFTHYGMQLGSGTLDFQPSLTYLGQSDWFSWGAQYSASIPLEDENESGYRESNQHHLTGWLAKNLNSYWSLSSRISYDHSGKIKGHYNGPHNHSSPGDFQQNYGSDIIELGIGSNLKLKGSPFKGQRLALEILFPIYQDLNGVQLEKQTTIQTGWQWAF